jgi:dTDP-glucose 4,6-dehydratase
VQRLWAEFGAFDKIFHFAAETHVDRSLIDATPFVRTNVAGTQVLLDALRQQQSGHLVHISTDEVYGPVAAGVFLREDARLAPRNPYAATKAAGDHLVMACGRSYGLDVSLVRSVNVYGPGQFPEKFIPLSVASLLDGKPIPLYGDGEQVRDWLYVSDYVRAVLAVAEQGTMGEIYHVSARDERPNRVVAESICGLMNVPVKDGITFVDDRPGHDRRYGLDSTKLRGLGWQPEVDFGKGLRRTIEWFKEHPQKPVPVRDGGF